MFDDTMLMGEASEASAAPTAKAFDFAKPKAKRKPAAKNHVCGEVGCGKAFQWPSLLKTHSYTHTGERPFACTHDGCNKAFTSNSDLTKHVRTHTGERPFACSHEGCDQAFAAKGNLITHELTHTGDKPFSCPHEGCGKAFSQKANRDIHIRRHTGDKPFACTHEGCNKAFTDLSDLNKHMRTHTGDKPFACSHEGCDYACAVKGNLITHELTHTGEKPFSCPHEGCNKAFTTKSNLDAHMLIHTGDKPFACPHKGCNYVCTKKINLDVHVRTHTGERPYTCDVDGCDHAFTTSSNLAEHVRIHHNTTYVARCKIAEERVRKGLVKAGWKEWFGDTLPPVNYFKRELRIDFKCLDPNSSYGRIDFVISTWGGLVFLEVDENQHRFGYHAELSCDMKRMNDVINSITLEHGEGKQHIYWLRYNPDAWHLDGETQRVPKAEREGRLMAHLAAVNLTEPLQVGYAYYDASMGELEVLKNEHYHPMWAEVTHDLGGLGALVHASNVDAATTSATAGSSSNARYYGSNPPNPPNPPNPASHAGGSHRSQV